MLVYDLTIEVTYVGIADLHTAKPSYVEFYFRMRCVFKKNEAFDTKATS